MNSSRYPDLLALPIGELIVRYVSAREMQKRERSMIQRGFKKSLDAFNCYVEYSLSLRSEIEKRIKEHPDLRMLAEEAINKVFLLTNNNNMKVETKNELETQLQSSVHINRDTVDVLGQLIVVNKTTGEAAAFQRAAEIELPEGVAEKLRAAVNEIVEPVLKDWYAKKSGDAAVVPNTDAAPTGSNDAPAANAGGAGASTDAGTDANAAPAAGDNGATTNAGTDANAAPAAGSDASSENTTAPAAEVAAPVVTPLVEIIGVSEGEKGANVLRVRKVNASGTAKLLINDAEMLQSELLSSPDGEVDLFVSKLIIPGKKYQVLYKTADGKEASSEVFVF